MDAKIIDEDFRRATKDARSNWTQVDRSLDKLMKSTKSNSQIQAQLSPPSESGPQIQSDPSSQHVLPSEPDSQEEISTDSCDQDYYLPDANTPLLDIVQSMSDKTETKIEDPTEVTINVEDDATDKVHGPKIVSDKAQTIPPAARLPIKGTTKQVPKGKRPIPKVKASFSILSRDRPQQLIRVQNNSGLIAIPISSSTSEPFPKQIQLNGRSLNVIQLPSMINGMTVTTTPIPPISSATNGLQEPTIISLPDMNDVSNSFKLVNIPQNEQQITKFPVWEIPKNTKPSEQKSVSELLRVNR
ncbi:unnamed protein product [Oikopleura dioica]|uniref:Uncharacterized protein n=1 Tax=Oikopleura dioica TaxID=34765 RepID=E4YP73_OIKDI|nr:unnamed protein product [Oikopleura dioica]